MVTIKKTRTRRTIQSFKRFKLHDNKSAKIITNESLEEDIEFIKKSKDQELKPLAKTIDKIIKKKFKYVILEDELQMVALILYLVKEKELDKYKEKYNLDITQRTMPEGLVHDQRLWNAGRRIFSFR